MKYDLSILIPARNEMFLKNTVEDILAHKEGKTEIIVVLDGAPADPPLEPHPDVTVLFHPAARGQRAATNEAASLAQGKYVAKVDAHCSFDQGFDVKLMSVMHDDWTIVPMMRNLHVFDWVCPAGHRRYQGPQGPCEECGQPTTRDVLWHAKKSPKSYSYCFDDSPHFQYFEEFEKRKEFKGDLTETMSLQGSFFMATRKKFFELGLCDEAFGSWGSQGIEVAVKTWLSGGKVMCYHKTWYAHLFRTQGKDFSFPYENPHSGAVKAQEHARKLFFDNKWPGQVHPLSWLLERFWPVPGWSQANFNIQRSWPIQTAAKKASKGVLYYTHGVGDPLILSTVRTQLIKGIKEKHIIAVSHDPIGFGARNIVYPRNPQDGWLDLFMRILIGLEASEANVIFFAEHDVLYHPSHFDFIPPKRDVFYYNTNVWKLRVEDGHALYVNDCKQLSGLCAWRELLLQHYRERVHRVRNHGFTRANGFEPGTRNIAHGGFDNYSCEEYRSAAPNIDIRHGYNATQNRWSKDQFRNQKYTDGWTEAEGWKIPGWDFVPRFTDNVNTVR